MAQEGITYGYADHHAFRCHFSAAESRADAAATTPEAILIADVEKSNPPKPGELLKPLIGAIDLGVSDAGENHDRYIGDALVEELRGQAP